MSSLRTGRAPARRETGAASLPGRDTDGERVSVNPLAGWPAARIDAYTSEHGLPPHPLRALGYLSIGCAPCTMPTVEGADIRAGRWRGRDKTECGIHFAGPARHGVTIR